MRKAFKGWRHLARKGNYKARFDRRYSEQMVTGPVQGQMRVFFSCIIERSVLADLDAQLHQSSRI